MSDRWNSAMAQMNSSIVGEQEVILSPALLAGRPQDH
jgi:hypothetical protein